ncbi:hypothetical protein SAMN05892883_1108 [Jatrophihabitans sp. GAS493]|uniref:hypothetical protein n=1 Tax=Jatrophihabitans sp. GAS493 TaxID=1907575 RepID=UPI000BB7D73A|nr:hypothetical protein [Jatrophihabitans sp. GAS493]SOD71613.1 hypothetical protein SAMN05892883_1108 [Jatrophihabitans sp. GAS493]
MSNREWENLEIIETFGEQDVYRAFAAPAQRTAATEEDSVDVGVEPGSHPPVSTSTQSTGMRWRLAGAVLLTALLASLVGYAVGNHTGRGEAERAPVASSAAVDVTPLPTYEFTSPDQGPCDRLAATTDEIVPTSPLVRAMHWHFPTFQISSLSTSRYDDNDQVCNVAVDAVDASGITATVQAGYYGIGQDSSASGVSSFQGQFQESYDHSSMAHNYQVTVSMSSLNKSRLPAPARLVAFATDPLLYGN